MKLVSAQMKFEILGYPLLDFSGIATGDAQKWLSFSCQTLDTICVSSDLQPP